MADRVFLSQDMQPRYSYDSGAMFAWLEPMAVLGRGCGVNPE
jgi:hypothetical protein